MLSVLLIHIEGADLAEIHLPVGDGFAVGAPAEAVDGVEFFAIGVVEPAVEFFVIAVGGEWFDVCGCLGFRCRYCCRRRRRVGCRRCEFGV